MDSSVWAFWVVGGTLGAGGIALLARALFADRARGRRRCPGCWYDMAGVPGLTCPECGRTAANENRLGRTRRRWRSAVIGLFIVGAGAATTRWAQIASGNWPALVPDGVLRLVLSQYRGDAAVARGGGASMAAWSAGQTWSTSHWQRLLVASECSREIDGVIDKWEAGGGVQAGLVDSEIRELGGLWGDASIARPTVRRLVMSPLTPLRDRLAAMQLLAGIDSSSAGAAVLGQIARNSARPDVRLRAIMLLAEKVRTPRTTRPALVAALGDEEASTRDYAAFMLGRMGRGARSALGELDRVAKEDSQVHVRETAGRAAARVRGGGE